MNNVLKHIFAILIAGMLAQLSASAQFVSYTVTTNNDSHPSDPAVQGVVAPDQSPENAAAAPASNFTYGSGVNVNNYPFGLSFFPVSGSIVPQSLASAVSTNFYFGFTVTPTVGTTLNLSSLDLSSLFSEGTDFNSQTYAYAVESSIDGFGTSNILATVPFDDRSGVNGGAGTPGPDVTLGSEFQNITTPVTFRLYYYGVGNTDNYQTLNINDGSILQLNGAVAVPEPSTYALLGISVLLLLCVQRIRGAGFIGSHPFV